MVRQTKIKGKPAQVAKKREGRPTSKALRWTLQQAATEFGNDRTQLERRRRALFIEPGEDGCFSSREIAALIFGDKEAEIIGKLAAERKHIEIKNAQLEAELVPTAAVCQLMEGMFVVIRQKICSSKMPQNLITEILEDLVSMGERDWAAEMARGGKK